MNNQQVPLLIDPDDYFKTIKLFNEFKRHKKLQLEISNKIIEKLEVPKKVIQLADDYNIPLHRFINNILNEFVFRMERDEKFYNLEILYIIKNDINLKIEDKERLILKIIEGLNK
jgi:hypothetical protein